MPDSNGDGDDVFIHGILFKSSAMKDGINIVLFRGSDISTTNSANSKDAWLRYKGNNIRQVTEIIVKADGIKAQPGA